MEKKKTNHKQMKELREVEHLAHNHTARQQQRDKV